MLLNIRRRMKVERCCCHRNQSLETIVTFLRKFEIFGIALGFVQVKHQHEYKQQHLRINTYSIFTYVIQMLKVARRIL